METGFLVLIDLLQPYIEPVLLAVLIFVMTMMYPQVKGYNKRTEQLTEAIDCNARVMEKISLQLDSHAQTDEHILRLLRDMNSDLQDHRIHEGGD